MNKELAQIRTKSGRVKVPILGGFAIGEQVERSEKEKLRSQFKIINEDGSAGYNDAEFIIALFKRALVAVEGFADENGDPLELSEELKEAIVSFEPSFVKEFMIKVSAAFAAREDLVAKN